MCGTFDFLATGLSLLLLPPLLQGLRDAVPPLCSAGALVCGGGESGASEAIEGFFEGDSK